MVGLCFGDPWGLKGLQRLPWQLILRVSSALILRHSDVQIHIICIYMYISYTYISHIYVRRSMYRVIRFARKMTGSGLKLRGLGGRLL